ncbi:hypothetical protein PHLGIDRAFT_235048 [Phlebiopsis gigantea 11061_1 CR5-6]|uniref:D-lactate dehydratase n=1 Tax=Phlebiopsis gigantea (strain 11061_1 CR5-6) TaxID=745531 RepID=A0A0C3S220_PHLG1|nr:hypothetical protein PHLGIDRAFT_235048 [Phlebiopsis gigantea 11061_1 CR5-6]
MPNALILIAQGSEEVEFSTTFTTLVRAGIPCTSAYVPENPAEREPSDRPPLARCSEGIHILPDTFFSAEDCTPDKYDLLVVPGGSKSSEIMSASPAVQQTVRNFLDAGRVVGMICAGVRVAKAAGLPQQPVTSHPVLKSELEDAFEFSDEYVVISGKLVTGRGPGASFLFALTLVDLLCGEEKRKEVAGPLMLPPGLSI